ncbi:hypothetical protein ACFOZY_13545, partial [Chungangia koreensis]
GGGSSFERPPLEVPYHPITLNKTIVDSTFFNKLFTRFVELAQSDSSKGKIEEALNGLHSKFSSLTREQQDYAEIIIQEIQNGKRSVDEGTDFLQMINEYQFHHEIKILKEFAGNFGLDVEKLKQIKNNVTSEKNLNQYGQFNNLKNSVDLEKAKEFIERENGQKLPRYKINQEIDKRLRNFILDK